MSEADGTNPADPLTPRTDVQPQWRARVRRWLTPWNIVFVVLLVWAAPRLLPHLGAVVGVRSGPELTPEYSYASLDGAPLASDSLRGQVVLVNFWATWCLPCRAEMPMLEATYKRHRDAGFTIIGLAVDRAPTSDVAAFVRDRGVTYPVAHVGREAERRFGGVQGYPTSFLLDREGRIVHRVIGPVGPLSLEPAIRRALAAP